MDKLFDEYGHLNIEELIANQPSFLKIMEDGIVTEDEVAEQTKRVISLLRDLEKKCDDSQINGIKELLAEVSVLIAIREFSKNQK